jgi:hypothetical protein
LEDAAENTGENHPNSVDHCCQECKKPIKKAFHSVSPVPS